MLKINNEHFVDDGIVSSFDMISLEGSIEKDIADSILEKILESRNLTVDDGINQSTEEINKLLAGIKLNTRLVDIQPNKPIFESFNGKRVSIHDLSAGEKHLYYRAVYLNKLKLKSSIILVDEPEVSLHPTWQKEILKLYQNVRGDNQIIFATHSPHIIASVKPENLFLLYPDEDTGKMTAINMAKAHKHTKGVEPNRILQEIMGMEELRDAETQDRVREIAELIRLHPEEINEPENQDKIESLIDDLGEQDPSVMRIKHQLFILKKRQSAI